MKKIKLMLFLTIVFFTFQSCQTVKEGFTSQKKKSTDEFLVEKKSPLVMPPEFEELPIPKIDDDIDAFNNEDNSSNIEKLISNNDSEVSNSVEPNENFEKSIINQIKKN
jgi:D-alanyl-lipoteichoic acid acyltransferase DltB (MBOAT superfamily)